jgi:hypothetical protein
VEPPKPDATRCPVFPVKLSANRSKFEFRMWLKSNETRFARPEVLPIVVSFGWTHDKTLTRLKIDLCRYNPIESRERKR